MKKKIVFDPIMGAVVFAAVAILAFLIAPEAHNILKAVIEGIVAVAFYALCANLPLSENVTDSPKLAGAFILTYIVVFGLYLLLFRTGLVLKTFLQPLLLLIPLFAGFWSGRSKQ